MATPKIQAVLGDDEHHAARVCKKLGPEGFAVLDTLRAAVHARRIALDNQNASFDALTQGNSPAARFLRAYQHAPDLFAFGASVARSVLPYNGALLLTRQQQPTNTDLRGGFSTGSSRSAADIFDVFDKTLDNASAIKKGEAHAQKLQRTKDKLVDENYRCTCMAICSKEWSLGGAWHSLRGTKDKPKDGDDANQDCGGAPEGHRCRNLVATLSPDGKTVVGNLAGFHVDTANIPDSKAKQIMSKIWKAGKATFTHMLTGTVSENDVTGVGAWASKHLVGDWRNIDHGKIHICHHHAEIIRKKNPAYYLMLVFSTMGRVAIAMKMQSLIDYYRASEIIAEGTSDGVITPLERRRINSAMNQLDPSARDAAMAYFKDAKYSDGAELLFQNGQLLPEAKAAATLKKMGTFLKNKSIDADGWTPKDRQEYDAKFGGLQKFSGEGASRKLLDATADAEENEFVQWSDSVNKAMKDNQIDDREMAELKGKLKALDSTLDIGVDQRIKKGVENRKAVKAATEDGWISVEEEKELKRRKVTDTDVDAIMEKNKGERDFFEQAIRDGRVDADEAKQMKTMSKGAQKHYGSIVAAGKTLHRLLASQEGVSANVSDALSGSSLAKQQARYAITEKEQKQLRGQMKKHPAGTPLGDQLRARLGDVRSAYKTPDGIPPTQKQFKKLAFVEKAAKGGLTPLEEQKAKKLMGKDWEAFGMDKAAAVQTGRAAFAAAVQKVETQTLGDGLVSVQEFKSLPKDMREYLQKSDDPVAVQYQQGRSLHALVAKEGRGGEGGISAGAQKRLAQAMRENPEKSAKMRATMKKMGVEHFRSDGVPTSKEELAMVKIARKYARDDIVLGAEDAVFLKNGGDVDKLRLVDPEAADAYTKAQDRGEELMSKVAQLAGEGRVLLATDTITLGDGTSVKADKAFALANTAAKLSKKVRVAKNVDLSLSQGVRNFVEKQRRINTMESKKFDKGIGAKDTEILDSLPEDQRAKIVRQLVHRGAKSFAHGTSTRKGELMTTEDVKLVGEMAKARAELTAVGDWEKLGVAASWTDGAAMQKMIKKLESKRATVAKFEKRAGDKFDDLRREAGAVGTGDVGLGEDPLDSAFIDGQLATLKEKLKTTKWWHAKYRVKEATEGAGQIAFDVGQGAKNVATGAKDAAVGAWQGNTEAVDLQPELDDTRDLERELGDDLASGQFTSGSQLISLPPPSPLARRARATPRVDNGPNNGTSAHVYASTPNTVVHDGGEISTAGLFGDGARTRSDRITLVGKNRFRLF